MELTADQARKLARSYFDLAQALGEYRFDQFDALTPTKRKKMEAFERTLLDSSTAFTSLAMSISLADLEPVLTRIDEVTATLKDNINQLQKVDRVLNIAGSAVQLASAILTGNPTTIFKAADDAVSIFA